MWLWLIQKMRAGHENPPHHAQTSEIFDAADGCSRENHTALIQAKQLRQFPIPDAQDDMVNECGETETNLLPAGFLVGGMIEAGIGQHSQQHPAGEYQKAQHGPAGDPTDDFDALPSRNGRGCFRVHKIKWLIS